MERTLSQISLFENLNGVNHITACHIIASSKISHQDLSIEGVKHFFFACSAAQTWAFFD